MQTLVSLIVVKVLLTSGFQISGDLAYDTLYIEGRFLQFQVSCPGRALGCLPFKIQGRAADVPGMTILLCVYIDYVMCVYIVICVPVVYYVLTTGNVTTSSISYRTM